MCKVNSIETQRIKLFGHVMKISNKVLKSDGRVETRRKKTKGHPRSKEVIDR